MDKTDKTVLLVFVSLSTLLVLAAIAYKRIESHTTASAPNSACQVESEAVQPYLPAVGDRIVGSGHGHMGFRNPRFGHVTEVRERCYSNAYAVLLIVDGWNQAPPNTPDSAIDVTGWLNDLMETGHNPRAANRRLSFKVVLNHATSPTGVEYYVLVYRAGYDPSRDEYFSDGVQQIQLYNSNDDYRHFNSKELLEDLW